jgi:long-chain acyl-CoA synthetase
MGAVLRTDVATLPALLAHRADELGDAPFVRDAQRTWSFGEFAGRVAQVAAGLAERGVRRGDVVAVILPNSPHYLEAWWAVLWLGATFNPVNPALTAREQTGILADSGAVLAIATPAAAAGLRDHAMQLPALREVLVADGPDPLAGLRTAGSALAAEIGGDHVASFVYTSGTTGRPKGAMLTHANLLANAWQLGELLPIERGDVLGMVLPLFHVNAQVVTTVVPLFLGAQVAMWERFSASAFWQEVERFAPVTFSAVPTMLAALLHAPGAERAAQGNTLRFVICGAAPLSPALFRRFEEAFGVHVLEGYGLTEGTCCSTLNPFAGPRKVGSIGLPTRGQEVRVVDDDGRPVPDGVRGEVCVRGPNVMAGYHQRPDATAQALRDGWLHTGDVGMRDADGFLWLVDRKKDMVIRGGENIYPREVEDVLLEHRAVREAAVVGRPDEVRGEEVHAVVALAAPVGFDELEAHCRARLAAFKVPSSWEQVDELPKTSTGKIDKKPLRTRTAA